MKTNMQYYQELVTEWNNLRTKCIAINNQLNDENAKLHALYDIENMSVDGGFDKNITNAISQQSQKVSQLYNKLIKLEKKKSESNSKCAKFKASVGNGYNNWKAPYTEKM